MRSARSSPFPEPLMSRDMCAADITMAEAPARHLPARRHLSEYQLTSALLVVQFCAALNTSLMSQPVHLVASATANTGRYAVEQLSAIGKVNIRALTRNPNSERAKHLAGLPNVTVVQGDFNDTASIKRAVQGVSRAYLVSQNGDDQQYDREVAFIEAATEANLEVVVRMSTTNCVIDINSSNVYARAHARIEQYIDQHNSKVVDLQADWFMSNLVHQAAEAKATGKVTMPVTAEHAATMQGIAMIDPRDAAGSAVAIMLAPQDELDKLLKARRLIVTGPEPITFTQQLEAVSKVTGKPLSVNGLSPEAFMEVMQQLGISKDMAEAYTSSDLMFAGLKERPRPYTAETSPALTAIWKPKYTLHDWARDNAAAFV